MEASTIPATAALAPGRASSGARISAGPLLRLRSDEQLVRLFRAGNEEAFRAIHDRYRARLFAYARQMLAGSRQDAEDALQDVFVRAYGALRANDRDVSLRAWLYRVAHNRCIDELRRPAPPPPETFELIRPPASDPIAATEQRESLRRLVADIERLPEQQRSALLMREISGMSYDDLAAALDVTVPAIKSLLVRARIGLAQAAEARDTACVEIREALADAHERGVRATGLARRHLQDCSGCRAYRGELRATQRRIAAFVPAFGPGALIAHLLGFGGAAGAGGAVAAGAGAGAAIGGGAAGVTAGHVVAVVAATVVSAGGAVELQRTLDARHERSPKAAVAQYTAPAAATPIVTPAGPSLSNADRHTARGHVVKVRAVPAPTVGEELLPPPVEAGPSNGGAGLPAELVVESPPADPPPAEPAPPAEPVVEPEVVSATSGSAPPPATTSSEAPPPGSAAAPTAP